MGGEKGTEGAHIMSGDGAAVGGKGKPKAKILSSSAAAVTLHVCARKGNLAAIRRMLERNASVGERALDTGKTPLHVAAQVCFRNLPMSMEQRGGGNLNRVSAWLSLFE